MYVDSKDSLEQFLEMVRGASVLAVDTEFVREKTYYPLLCSIQIASDDVSTLIDPFKVDVRGLNSLFTDPSVVKVFHASDQDREVIFNECGILPTPIFDTQMAASLVGFPQQVGYAALVNSICGVSLPKKESFTDWSRRPLTDTQIEYALDDVAYLPQIYRELMDRLQSSDRLHWLERDFADLSDPAAFQVDPRERWKHLKKVTSLSSKQMAIARELAAWREERAMDNNIPRKWVVPDEVIVEISRREPRTTNAVYEVRGVKDKLTSKQVQTILELAIKAMDSPPETWPVKKQRRTNASDYDGMVDLGMALLHLRAEENKVSTPLLSSRDELVRVAAGERGENVKVLHGWRYEMLGRELLELFEGKLSLSIQDGHLLVSGKESQ